MNKKIVFSLAASLAIVGASFTTTTAKTEAAGPAPCPSIQNYEVKTVYPSNIQDVEKWVQFILDQTGYAEVAKTVQPKPATTTVQKPSANVQTPVSKPATQAPVPSQNANAGLKAYEQQVIDLTNKERAKYGLPALKVDLALSKVAREKSRDMAVNHYFSHNSPTYGSPFEMMRKFGISYTAAGENIAKGQRTPQEVVAAWMNSPGHRANILNKNYTHIGVGFEENGYIWTQQFIRK
ncbi:CAP domain-containing protein [Parageobacillus sp. G301]|uniref:CAP domain-containing protein n=1 Tax=Parageobacillus sp. G301 TaxID=2998290 RepID=UPI0024989A63|nr:CAP domain-containing protein [Parageobacillus sp. G301]GLH62210.1 serine protease [Parageobacillus sp. G301]